MRKYEAMLTKQDIGQNELKADVQKKTDELTINKSTLKKAYSKTRFLFKSFSFFLGSDPPKKYPYEFGCYY